MQKSAFLFTCLLLAIPCIAETIIVDPNGSADFNNIQDAINYSWHGDTVIVRPGTYNESINFYGKAITVTSIDPNDPVVIESTVIRGSFSSYTIRFDCGEDENSVLTGFMVESGGDNSKIIYCYYSSPLILRNTIRATSGGCYGIFGNSASPMILHNLIIAYIGICNCDGEIRHCQIEVQGNHGLQDCDGLISNCIISGAYSGTYNCDGLIVNSTIVNNLSGLNICDGEIKNCIVAYNTSYGLSNCNAVINYNNVWGNTSGSYGAGTVPSPNDIHLDPQFVDFENSDYHLKSGAGRWDSNSENWVNDDVNSPCIDAGDPCDPIGVEPNPNGGRINMGAYGGTAEASKSTSGIVEPICTEYPAMDFNKDCKVDFRDFGDFCQSWLECNLDPPEACWE